MIALQDVTLRWKNRLILDRVDFVAPAHCVTALSGPGFSGKTALLQTIVGLRRPSAGTVRVGDFDPVVSPAEVRRRVSFVPAPVPFVERISVRAFVRFVTWVSTGRRPDKALVLAALRLSEVPDRATTDAIQAVTPFVRVCAWLAIHRLRDVSALIMDDPLSDLSAREVDDFCRLLRELATEGKTVLLTSRDTAVLNLVDYPLRIDEGRVTGPVTSRSSDTL